MGKMTNEHLRGIFDSNFDLTNFAIELAHYHIKKTPGVGLLEVLKEVQEHPEKDYLQTLLASDSTTGYDDKEEAAVESADV